MITRIAFLCLFLASFLASADPLGDCRRIEADAQRLACYDALADRPQPAAVAAPAAAAPSIPPEELFGRSNADVRRTAANDNLQELTAKVTDVQASQSGKLTVALDNGQVWSQIDTPSARIRVGDEVRIRRASLGSYLLTRSDGGAAIRVHRTR